MVLGAVDVLCALLVDGVDSRSTMMLTEMKLLAPERGSGPRTVIAVGPPRGYSSASSAHGALERGSQALSAGSTIRSKVVFISINGEH